MPERRDLYSLKEAQIVRSSTTRSGRPVRRTGWTYVLRRLERMSELGIPLVEIVPTNIYK
jgi:hypothetical protein